MTRQSNFSIIEAPSILGLKPTGVDCLPDALRKAGFYEKLAADFEARVAALEFNPQRDPQTHLLNAEGIATYSRSLSQVVEPVVRSGRFPIVLGGDCSILLGNLLALRRLGRYGLFFLDGHSDFCQPEADAFGEVASMDLAIATGRGPDIVSNINGLKPLVRDEDTVVFGDRDGEATEGYGDHNVRSTRIYTRNLEEVRQTGVKQAALEGLDWLMQKPLDGFWIHLDADVLDDAIMPAVDYRMPDGLSFAELIDVLQVLMASPKAIGINITIFNPKLDSDGTITQAFTQALVMGLTAH
ncbi:arginase family protein [Iningainema tapete]|uniref:Arginase family protein n=1 Tax=Iningainema tapete BLCC-T55 TaxID=2748662 RepID=A0A8J7CFS3_9CYAN|nr:arginase family protein [Iningainema tapete]MBD2775290.1 arginase family protein [Iningainema tapete BLCC-T55]